MFGGLLVSYKLAQGFDTGLSFECGSAFGHLLDDLPLLKGEISSSVLTATAFHAAGSGEKTALGDSGTPEEVEKGLLLLIASDTPGLQVHVFLTHCAVSHLVQSILMCVHVFFF